MMKPNTNECPTEQIDKNTQNQQFHDIMIHSQSLCIFFRRKK